jgi:hypothetical protein
MRHFKNGMLPGIAAAAYAGVLTAFELAGVNFIWHSPRNLALIIFWFAVLLAAGGAATGIIISLVSLARRWGRGKTLAFSIGAATAVLVFLDRFGMCYPCHQLFDLRSPHLTYTPLKSFAYTLGVGLAAVGAGAGSGAAGFLIWKHWRRRPVRGVFYAALVGSLIYASAASYLSTPDRGVRGRQVQVEAQSRTGGVHRLVLIVDEALTWDVIDPLLEKGSLPTFQTLIGDGVRGTLATDTPTLSHTVLTTVATGRNPTRHGIGSKVRYAFPGMTTGISTFPCPYRLSLPFVFTKLAAKGFGHGILLGTETRKVNAIWDILSDAGVSAGVAGWRCTWPAEHINGFMLSSQIEMGEPGDYLWPPDALPVVEEALSTCPEVAIDRFITDPAAAAIDDKRVAKRLANIKACIEYDLKYDLADRNLDDLIKPEFVALGLLSMDCAGHNFYLEHALSHTPDKFHMTPYLERYTSPEIVAVAGGVIDSAYVVHDRLIRDWIPDPGENSAIIIASDHGFEMNGSNHYYQAPGIIILNGRPFRQGASISGASIYDIAPTVLYLLGLAVPEDMEGEVLVDAFDPAWLEANPVRMGPATDR